MHARNSLAAAIGDMEVPGDDLSAGGHYRAVVFDDLLEHAGVTKPWVAVALGAALYVLYLLGIYMDGFQQVFNHPDFWKSSIEPPAILTYLLLVHHYLDVYGRRAVQSLRPVIDLDDRAFSDLVAGKSARILRYQWVAMIAFSGLSVLLLARWEDWSSGFHWSALIATTISLGEYALIGSTVFLVVTRNRFFTSLFRQPTRIDVFNPAPIKPMGRWGLSVSASIMGGVTISVLLVGDVQDLLSLDHLPAYVVATATAIVAFFGSLVAAHRALVHAKDRELNALRSKLSALYGELLKCPETSKPQDMNQMNNTITACLGYERRIADAQEWPYTAGTLRGLFATVLLPIIVTIIQQMILWW